jgi:hypothetical protein
MGLMIILESPDLSKAGKAILLNKYSAKKDKRGTRILGENINYNNASADKDKINSDSKYNRSGNDVPSEPKLNLVV